MQSCGYYHLDLELRRVDDLTVVVLGVAVKRAVSGDDTARAWVGAVWGWVRVWVQVLCARVGRMRVSGDQVATEVAQPLLPTCPNVQTGARVCVRWS